MPISSDTGAFSFRANVKPAAGQQVRARHVNDPLEDVQNALNGARPIQRGGTAASTASGARANLGVAIGSDVQAHSAKLDAIAGLTWADGKILTGAGENTIKGLTFRNRNDLGGASPDSSGVASEAATKNYVDNKDGATRTYAAGLVPGLANGSSEGLIKTGGDLDLANGVGTLKSNKVGYAELDAGTGATGQHLVKTAGGIGFTDAPRVPSRSALVAPAASMEWTIPAGVIGIRVDGSLTRGLTQSSIQPRSVSLQLGTAAAWGGSVVLNSRVYDANDYDTLWSAKPGEIWAHQDNFGESGPVTRARIVWAGGEYNSTYTGTGLRLFFF